MIYILHHNDADGIFAGYLVHYYLNKYENKVKNDFWYFKQICNNPKNNGFPESKFIEYNYGEDSKLEELYKRHLDDVLFIVDLGFDKEIISRLNNTFGHVVWIDHHETSLGREDEVSSALLSKNRSGAYLVHQYLSCDNEVPKVIELVDDFDRWQFKYSNTKNFISGFDLFEIDLNLESSRIIMNRIITDIKELENITKDGIIINEYKRNDIINKLKSMSYDIEIDGIKGKAFNGRASGFYKEFVSELYGDDYKIFISYYFNGKNWTLGFYSKEIPVLELAKSLGGGGHLLACGATTDTLPEYLNIKF